MCTKSWLTFIQKPKILQLVASLFAALLIHIKWIDMIWCKAAVQILHMEGSEVYCQPESVCSTLSSNYFFKSRADLDLRTAKASGRGMEGGWGCRMVETYWWEGFEQQLVWVCVPLLRDVLLESSILVTRSNAIALLGVDMAVVKMVFSACGRLTEMFSHTGNII